MPTIAEFSEALLPVLLAILGGLLFHVALIRTNKFLIKVRRRRATRRMAELTNIQDRIREAEANNNRALLKDLNEREKELVRLLNKEG